MLLIALMLGMFAGWLVNLAADILPRFAVQTPARPVKMARYTPLLALWSLVMRQPREDGFMLRLLVEAGSAAAFAYLWLRFGMSPSLVVAAFVWVFLTLIAVIDLKYRLVLNVMTYPALALVLVYHALAGAQPALNILLGGTLAFSIFALTAWLKPGQLGGGDVKLAALIGFTFGFPHVLWALMVGAGLGALVAVALLMHQHRRGSTIPYAPFLCFGALVALLYNPLLVM